MARPKPRLAVRALILHEDRLLLVNAYPGARLGLWCAPGGGCETGQSLPENLAREVMEETGVRVHVDTARYLASQPWPFPGSLMLGFIARAEPDTPRASEELEDARWFSADEVRAGLERDWRDADGEGEGIVLSSPVSISRHVIRCWLDEHDAAHAPR